MGNEEYVGFLVLRFGFLIDLLICWLVYRWFYFLLWTFVFSLKSLCFQMNLYDLILSLFSLGKGTSFQIRVSRVRDLINTKNQKKKIEKICFQLGLVLEV